MRAVCLNLFLGMPSQEIQNESDRLLRLVEEETVRQVLPSNTLSSWHP